MKAMSIFYAILLTAAGTAAFSVTVRHDVGGADYAEFAKKKELAPGLVVTRPFADIPGCGVLIHRRFVLTAGHIGSVEGPADMPVRYGSETYTADYVYLFPEFKKRKENWGGYDLAILRLKGDGIAGVTPAAIRTKGVTVGRKFIGVGRGKSGTGEQTGEPLPAGTFRGYENTIDYIFGDGDYNLLVADFDGPDGNADSLGAALFHPFKKKIAGNSSPVPLPLEGSLAAGDSGSGIFAEYGGRYYLIGIASFRIYSCYGAQSYYVNLGNPGIAGWIVSVCPGVEIGGTE